MLLTAEGHRPSAKEIFICAQEKIVARLDTTFLSRSAQGIPQHRGSVWTYRACWSLLVYGFRFCPIPGWLQGASCYVQDPWWWVINGTRRTVWCFRAKRGSGTPNGNAVENGAKKVAFKGKTGRVSYGGDMFFLNTVSEDCNGCPMNQQL